MSGAEKQILLEDDSQKSNSKSLHAKDAKLTQSFAKFKDSKPLRLSGSQPFTQTPGMFLMIGERTNVAGSPKFAGW